MSILLENYVQTSQGALERAIPPIFPGGIQLMDENGFVVLLSWMQIAIIVTTLVVLAAFTYLVTRTPLGRAMRAVEQDAKMAALLGIDTNRTISMTFVIGSALAAVAGFMFLLYYGVIDFYIGFNAGIKAFTAAVLGGIGSLPGAVLGGLLIGLIEAFWSGYATVAYKDVAVYSILAIVLMFMPTGLLGRHDVEKV
jgi:branched-chain amino acid transport system permease protein